jgi:hypothetical protein
VTRGRHPGKVGGAASGLLLAGPRPALAEIAASRPAMPAAIAGPLIRVENMGNPGRQGRGYTPPPRYHHRPSAPWVYRPQPQYGYGPPTESQYELRTAPRGYRTFRRWDTSPGPMLVPPDADIGAAPD